MTVDWSSIASSLAVAGIGWIIKGVRSVNNHLANLNGSVGKLQQWANDHERHDTERFDILLKRRRK